MKTFKEFKEILNFIKRGPERKGYYIKGVPKARVDKKGSAQVSKPKKGSWNDRQLKMTNEGVASLAIKGGSKLIPALMTGIGAAGTYLQSKGKFDKDAPQTRKGLKNIVKNADKNKLEPDTASDREELIAKSKPEVKDIVDKQQKKIDQGMDNLLDKIRKQGVIKPKKGEVTKQRELLRKTEKNITKPKSGEKKKAKKVVDTFKKVRKIEGKTMMRNKEDMEILKKGPGDLVPKARKTYLDKLLKNLRKEEVAIANSMGGGGIAGSVEAGDEPPVKKKKPPMLRRKTYAKGGTKSRKPWLDYLKNK